MVDFILAAKLQLVKDLTRQLNEAIREVAIDPLVAGEIKVEVEIKDCYNIGKHYPYPVLDVKVSQIKIL